MMRSGRCRSGLQQIPNADRRYVALRSASLQPNEIPMREAQFRCVLDDDNPVFG
jgi:hypothetical protein